MEMIQIKDNCWTCLGMNIKCEICDGTSEVVTWITLEDLLGRLLELKESNDNRANPIVSDLNQESFFESMKSMEPKPNPNI